MSCFLVKEYMNENNEMIELKKVVEAKEVEEVEDDSLAGSEQNVLQTEKIEDKVHFFVRPTMRELLKKRELDPKKATELEKGDFLAIIIAAATVFLPVILGAFAVIALLIWLIF